MEPAMVTSPRPKRLHSAEPRRLFVAYLPVGTDRQGQSGLGLEAQRALVKTFCWDDCPPVAEFVEVESGKDNDRPQLALALAECRRRKATLVIAKLDRLGRRLPFISGLMDEDVPFEAADMPHADRFRLHLEAVIAEDERRRISERTKAALAAAKERGTKRGGFRGQAGLGRCMKRGKRESKQARTGVIECGEVTSYLMRPAARPLAMRYETKAAHAPIMNRASASSTFGEGPSISACGIPCWSLV
jgi:DNA invertase Pin-like site-specific DNA recombinase